MPLCRTARKSETATLRLRSITASSPIVARSGGGGAIGYGLAVETGWFGVQPAAAVAARPEKRVVLRVIMPRE